MLQEHDPLVMNDFNLPIYGPQRPFPEMIEMTRGPQNAIKALFNHYIQEENGSPRLTREQTITLWLLQAIGASAAIYSFPISYEYAKDKIFPYKLSLVLSGVTSSTLFLTYLTGFFFQGQFIKADAPPSIRYLLKLPSKTQFWTEVVIVSGLSLICAIAFAIPTYLYPVFSQSDVWVGLEVAHSEIAQAIIHATAWGAILNGAFPLLNWLTAPVRWTFQKINNVFWLSSTEISLRALRKQQETIYQKYRYHLSDVIKRMAETLVSAEIHARNTPEAKDNKWASNSQVYTLEEFASIAYHATPTQTQTPASRKWCCCTAANYIMKNGGATALGASFFILGTLSTTINPLYIALDSMELSPKEAILATSLPIFSAGALAALYGGMFMNRLYNYVTSLSQPGDKIPIEARQYPKAFRWLFIANVYLSIFSFGPSQQLISIMFKDQIWDLYRPYLRAFAYAALPTVSCMSILDLSIDILRKFTAQYGKYEDQIIASLQLNADMMSQRILQLSGKELIASIARFSPDLQKFFGIDARSFSADFLSLGDLQKRIDDLNNSSVPQQKYSTNRQLFLRKDDFSPKNIQFNSTLRYS